MSACCKKNASDDTLDCYIPTGEEKPSAECLESPLTASQFARKTSSLPCLKSSSRISLAENDYEALQIAFFSLTSHFAKVQFRLRQIIQAHPSERDRLLCELAAVAFCGIEEFKCEGLPRMEKDFVCLGNIRRRQGDLIQRLRGQMDMLTEQTTPAEVDREEQEVETSDKTERKEKQKGVAKKISKTNLKNEKLEKSTLRKNEESPDGQDAEEEVTDTAR